MSNSSNITFDQYKHFKNLGWSVIPWVLEENPNGKPKKFCPIKWKEYQTRLASDEELQKWDGKYNALALVTGQLSGIVVIDIDEEVDAEKYPYLSSSVVVKSAFSGGKHFYYEYDVRLAQFGPQAKIEGKPMDYRGEGGLVILPGSFLGDKTYEFEEFAPFGLEPIPAEVYEFLKNPAPLFEKNKVVIFKDVVEGDRNQTATRVAGKLLEGTKMELWEVSVWGPFQAWNQEYCDPPLSEAELRGIYESVRTSEQRNRIINIDFSDVDKRPSDFETRLKKQLKNKKKKKFLSGYKYFDGITNGFKYSNTYLVTGLEKSGKSSWLMKMLQQKIDDGTKIGYVNTELPQSEFVQRMTAYQLGKEKSDITDEEMKAWSAAYKDRLCYLGVEDMPDQQGMLKKVEEFSREGIECLIFDNITSWGNKSQVKEGWQVMADLIDNLIQFTKRAGIITFMVIHLRPGIVENASKSTIKQIIKEERYDDIFEDQAMVVRKPSLSDVYGGGGALSQVSGTIIIWRPFQKFELEAINTKSAIIAESFRHCPNGMISADFDGAKGVFTENKEFQSDIEAIGEVIKPKGPMERWKDEHSKTD